MCEISNELCRTGSQLDCVGSLAEDIPEVTDIELSPRSWIKEPYVSISDCCVAPAKLQQSRIC